MSSPNLPDGAFLTSINGRRCTAIPRADALLPTPPAPGPPQQTSIETTPAPVATDSPIQDDPPNRGDQLDPQEPPEQVNDETPDSPGADGNLDAEETPVISPAPLPTEEPDAPTSATGTPAFPSIESPISSAEQVDETPTTRATPIRTPPQASVIPNPFTPPSSPITSIQPVIDQEEEVVEEEVVAEASPGVLLPGDDPAQSSGVADTRPTSFAELDVPSSLSSSLIPDAPTRSSSGPENSETDGNAAPPQADTGGNNSPQEDNEEEQEEGEEQGNANDNEDGPEFPEDSDAGPGATGLPDTEGDDLDGGNTVSVDGATAGENNDDGNGGVATVSSGVIAGSVVGSVAFLTMIALLFWFWRKRRRNRRETLLTPLTTEPPQRQQGRPYVFDQESLGPTPKSAKFRAALGYRFQRVRGQFGDLLGSSKDGPGDPSGAGRSYANIPAHSRNNSLVSDCPPNNESMSAGERFKNWWDRMTADAVFNWKTRQQTPRDIEPFAAAREKHQEKTGVGAAAQPDFLTLLGMDEKQVEREAEKKRMSRKNASTSSMDQFLDGLSQNVDGSFDPFGDHNAVSGAAAAGGNGTGGGNSSSSSNNNKDQPPSQAFQAYKPTASAPGNPFTDSNAITEPSAAVKPAANYVADVRRSRGYTQPSRPPSTEADASKYQSMYRESGDSIESFRTRRDKCKSDPFDLDRPELLGHTPTSAVPMPPGPAHTRADSYGSKYSSGVSSQWSEPGPDVGPSAMGSGNGGAQSRRQDKSRTSDMSQGSVGKAL